MSYDNQVGPRLSDCMTQAEEIDYYSEILERVFRNPRYYLDNLEQLVTFKVSWCNYHRNKTPSLAPDLDLG